MRTHATADRGSNHERAEPEPDTVADPVTDPDPDPKPNPIADADPDPKPDTVANPVSRHSTGVPHDHVRCAVLGPLRLVDAAHALYRWRIHEAVRAALGRRLRTLAGSQP